MKRAMTVILCSVAVCTYGEDSGQYIGFAFKRAVMVHKVFEGTTAAKMGIRDNDIILKVGDKSVSDERSLMEEITKYKANDEIRFSVMRNSEIVELKTLLPSNYTPPIIEHKSDKALLLKQGEKYIMLGTGEAEQEPHQGQTFIYSRPAPTASDDRGRKVE